MNSFAQLSDPLPLGFRIPENPETSTLSDAGTAAVHSLAHSDEEVILASSRPKRRAGRRVFKETRHPIYRGVRQRNNNKWVCELREPNKKSRIWLGTYPTAEMAARAHDVAALALRRKSTKLCLNFADSAWRLPIPASTDPDVIRTAAVRAANEFRDEECYTDDVVQVAEPTVAEDRGRMCNYIDDEDISNMPMLLASMAEGLLLSPPHLRVHDDMEWDDVAMSYDVSLWSF